MGKNITILGAGLMGAAFAKLYLEQGYQVTVWNRTAGKCDLLTEKGANEVRSLSEALAQSSTVLVLLLDYTSLKSAITTSDISIAGKDFINLMTGTPAEARAMSEYIALNKGNYLDGSIEGYPGDIGKSETLVFYSGTEALWDKHQDTLMKAGGKSRWVGEPIGAANILDAAMAGGFGVTCVGAFLESVEFARKAGVGVEELGASVDYFLASVKNEIESIVSSLITKNFYTEQATLSVYVSALKAWQKTMQEAGHSAGLVSANLLAMERGVANGHGSLGVAATYSPPAQNATT
ncbi:hypothetical protein AEQ67_19160 [Pseudomonas sp. RIT-PI-q]|nr:hypothetical protein AEQ67_19160 [Pseudomonas sp. RIT-PI-q]